MGCKTLESAIQWKIEVMERPYYLKPRCEAYRCLHCPTVKLSKRMIEIHCAVEHGIWRWQ